MNDVAERNGMEYYHFLQPNQYLPGSKPLSNQEMAKAYLPDTPRARNVRNVYPLLIRQGRYLSNHGVRFFDLTQIFRDNHETLYRDDCCHFNRRGYELLAEAMLGRILETTDIPQLAPAGYVFPPPGWGEIVEKVVEDTVPIISSDFDVYLTETGLLYVNDRCEDNEAPFFLHLYPVDKSDLPLDREEYGYDNRDFPFNHRRVEAGGRCAAVQILPSYEISTIRTGQYTDEGRIWEGEYSLYD